MHHVDDRGELRAGASSTAARGQPVFKSRESPARPCRRALQYESCLVVIVDGKWAPAPKGWGDADGTAVAGNPSGGDRPAQVTSVRHDRSASRLHCVIDGLDEDDDFVLRLSARNGVGRSEWTDNVRASALAEAEPELDGLKELPPLWRELVVNLDDVFEQLGLRIDGGAIELDTTKGLIWEELAAALVRHLAALKLAFKMYSLMGSTDDDPNDMSQLQYLRFVKDAQIREHLPDVPPREQGHKVSGVDCDLVFVAANREEARVSALESQGLGDPLAKKKSNAASSSPDGGSPGGGAADDDNRTASCYNTSSSLRSSGWRTSGTRTARGWTARRRRPIRSRRPSR